jgi:hypothetical protein
MTDKIRDLLGQIAKLEEQLQARLHEQESRIVFQIKHAGKVLGTHARYARFLEYGDAEDYHDRLEQFRQALAKAPAGDSA